jgi:hypothetical protein
MMTLLYGSAEDAVVYLGEPTDKTPIAFEASYALASLEGVCEDQIPFEKVVQEHG